METKEYFKVKAEMRNSAAASFCVEALYGFTTWVKYEIRNHSSDFIWAFCNAFHVFHVVKESGEGGLV